MFLLLYQMVGLEGLSLCCAHQTTTFHLDWGDCQQSHQIVPIELMSCDELLNVLQLYNRRPRNCPEPTEAKRVAEC